MLVPADTLVQVPPAADTRVAQAPDSYLLLVAVVRELLAALLEFGVEESRKHEFS